MMRGSKRVKSPTATKIGPPYRASDSRSKVNGEEMVEHEDSANAAHHEGPRPIAIGDKAQDTGHEVRRGRACRLCPGIATMSKQPR